jgi:hypothetical protein
MKATPLTDFDKLDDEFLSGAWGERLFERFLGGTRINGHGYDVVAGPKEEKYEIKSRLIGTDNGDRGPRITVTYLKVKVADFLAWVHYDELGRLVRAWIVPMSAIRPLYERYKQASGKAHLPWRALIDCPGARDVTKLLSA